MKNFWPGPASYSSGVKAQTQIERLPGYQTPFLIYKSCDFGQFQDFLLPACKGGWSLCLIHRTALGSKFFMLCAALRAAGMESALSKHLYHHWHSEQLAWWRTEVQEPFQMQPGLLLWAHWFSEVVKFYYGKSLPNSVQRLLASGATVNTCLIVPSPADMAQAIFGEQWPCTRTNQHGRKPASLHTLEARDFCTSTDDDPCCTSRRTVTSQGWVQWILFAN